MKIKPQINDDITIPADYAEKERRQLIERLKLLATANGQSVTVKYYPMREKRPEMIRRV